MGLVTNTDLRQAVWGIVIKNCVHKCSFIVDDDDVHFYST